MRSMELPQPRQRSGILRGPRILANRTAKPGSLFIRHAGGKPVTTFPGEMLDFHGVPVPAPFPDLLFEGKYADQPEGQDPLQVEEADSRLHIVVRAKLNQVRNHNPAA